jgi:DNA-directed RNA polymerase subunit alpha
MVVDGIKESIVDFMLHLKELRFTLDEVVTGEQFVPQKFSGVGKYTAADLKFPSGITLLNPEVYLIEITDPSVELVFDLRIEKGYGYYSLDFLRSREKKTSASDTNMILIDNDFRIVEYVKYDVEQVIEDFSGSTKDHLNIEIKMLYKGVTPKQFLAFAGEVLASYAKILIYDDIYIDRSVLVEFEEISGGKEKLSEETNVKTMPIDALPLSERTRNALIKNKILYVEDLEKQKKNELLLMKGVGRKAVDEISVALGNIGKALIG